MMVQESVSFKEIIGDALIDLAREDSRVLVFDADLVNASGLRKFAEKYPDRLIDCGIQEANMVGMAAAASEAGVIPFAHTFAAFAARKCVDQIFLAACYSKLDLKLIGSDPGVTAATNGGSHQGMEDMGILMGLNNITLLEPSDGILFRWMLREVKNTPGVFYIRTNRKEERKLYEGDTTFQLGKGNVLQDGRDVTIIASGIEVYEALDAAKLLEEKGISVRVVDMFCWRPVDKELVIRCAKETGAIVTAENHATSTGLGSAVANVVVNNCPVPMEFIGVTERFGEVGSIAFLQKKFNMDAQSIVKKVEIVIGRKGGRQA
ncbi:MAG: transketolase family protein [Lachnospiraceae bacterium]|nr:transketolase family protein [Lachnospiraceae bacterium]